MIVLKWKIFNLPLLTIVIFLVFSFESACVLKKVFADCHDVDFSEVQARYDRSPVFFNNNTWLSNIRDNTRIRINGGRVSLDNLKALRLTSLAVRLTGPNCDFKGVRIVLTDRNNAMMDRVLIDKTGIAVFNIPQHYEQYPLKISVPLLKKERFIEHYSKNIFTEAQLRSYLCYSNITIYNKDLYKTLLLIWIEDPWHINLNIFNKMADLLKFAGNDTDKLAVICSSRKDIKTFMNGIDELDENNNNVSIFKNRLSCLFN